MKTPISQRIKQHRAARGITQEELARKAGVSYATLTKIESGAIKNPSLNVVAKLASALNASLDDFVMIETYHEKNSLRRIWSDVLESSKENSEMYIGGVDERLFLKSDKKALLEFIEELDRRKIKQKILSCEGDHFGLKKTNLEYRWIPKEFFNPIPIYVYGDSLATVIWGPPEQIVILKNPQLAEAYRRQFLFMWAHAKPLPQKKLIK